VREECLGDCAVYCHLDPDLVVKHGAQIADSTHDEPKDVRRRELLGPWWAHGEMSVRICERPRPFHENMLRRFPSTRVRSSATAHERRSRDHSPFTKAVALATHYCGVKAIEPLTMLLTVDRASTKQRARDPEVLAGHPA